MSPWAGIDGCAPALVVASEPLITPIRAHSAIDRPSARAAANAPQNASPAPVVSTTVTARAGISSIASAVARSAPEAPRVMTTASGPRWSRSVATEAQVVGVGQSEELERFRFIDDEYIGMKGETRSSGGFGRRVADHNNPVELRARV